MKRKNGNNRGSIFGASWGNWVSEVHSQYGQEEQLQRPKTTHSHMNVVLRYCGLGKKKSLPPLRRTFMKMSSHF